MIQDPPVTGSAELNSFLVDVKNSINTATKPLAGWKLSDFEAGVSEVISDKRDLIDIVTAWDDLVNIRNNFETEVARYETLYSDSKVLGNQYQEYADTFSQIMEWWDQNVRLIEDIEAFMIEVNEDVSAAASSASAAKTSETKAKTSETNAGNSASAASSSASSAATSASTAASSASAAATSETNADESENVALDASAAAIVAAINVAQYVGTGFPNGVVTAPVGSIYTDTAATNGAIRWIKTPGSGPTGWRVTDGDTGLRLMPESMMENGWTTNLGFLCTLRRVGSLVSVSWNVSPPFPNHDTIGIIPAGFRPTVGEVNILTSTGLTESTALMNILVSPYGEWRRYSGRSSDTTSVVAGSTTWVTTDPWPTTLPGTPA